MQGVLVVRDRIGFPRSAQWTSGAAIPHKPKSSTLLSARIPKPGARGCLSTSTFTIRFSEMSEEESAPLLDYLYRHLVRPEFTCRFRWSANAIAFWDNRCVQHYAINDYHGQRRVMHRVTVNGDRPY